MKYFIVTGKMVVEMLLIVFFISNTVKWVKALLLINKWDKYLNPLFLHEFIN